MEEKKKKFDKSKYDYEYRLEHYKEFRCYLSIEEFNFLNDLLKQKKISKSDFVRNAFEELKKK